MTSIIDFALSKAKTTMMIALMVVIAGSYARQEIPIAASPNVQLPFISVSVFLDGASPGDTSRLIARPLENRLKTITGVKNISRGVGLGLQFALARPALGAGAREHDHAADRARRSQRDPPPHGAHARVGPRGSPFYTAFCKHYSGKEHPHMQLRLIGEILGYLFVE